MVCRCKCEFDSQVSSRASISTVRQACRRLLAHNWWWALQRRRDTMRCSLCSPRRAKCTICREQLVELWFDRCWGGLVGSHIDRMRTSRAPWSIVQSRQLAWYHDTCCHQSLPQSSRIPKRFCTRISSHEFLRHMLRCMDSSRHVWICGRWKKNKWNIFCHQSFVTSLGSKWFDKYCSDDVENRKLS